MNHPIVRFISIVAIGGIILSAVGIGAYQQHGIWVALAAILVTGWLIGRLLSEGMFFGAMFEHYRLKAEDQKEFEDARFDSLDKELEASLQEAADVVTDADLQEALHHFTHIAAFCPGSKGHAERLQVVLEHLQMRLSASTVQPMSAEERPIVH